jgi:osmotically-inducible protein OsmY
VLVAPIHKVASGTAVEIARDHPYGKKVPIFFVVPDRTSSQAVRRLYKAGVTAVFNWPRESEILATLFAEAFGIVRIRGRSSQADKALARTVRAHLRIGPSRGTSGLRLFNHDGLVSVSGRVRTLAHRREIIETIAAVPGVRAVIAETLRVQAEAIPSRKLSQRIRGLITQSVELDPSTLAVTVHNGIVKLSGTAADRSELRRLEELISNLKGVREFQSSVGVSAETQRRDSRGARRLMHVLANLYPQEDISLAVYDGIAVISGQVRRLSVKRSIERLLRSSIDVRRVVNKLNVQPPERS